MSTDDPWKGSEASSLPGAGDAPPVSAAQLRRFPGGELPSVTVILGELLTDLMGNFAGWLMFGVGNLAFMFLALLLIVPAYLMMIIPLMTNNDDSMMIPGMIVLFVAILLVSVLQLPWTNGQYRAMLAYQRGEQPLTPTAPLAHATTDIGAVLVMTVIQFAIAMLAVLACYFPVFFVSGLLGLAWPALVVHRLSAVDAVSLSIRHARQYPMWTLGFWALGFGIAMVGSQIPIIGVMLVGPVYYAYHLRAYRQIYGDGPVPVEDHGTATALA